MQEYAWLCNERNKILTGDNEEDEDFEWIEMPDYKSGEIKRYKKYKNGENKI